MECLDTQKKGSSPTQVFVLVWLRDGEREMGDGRVGVGKETGKAGSWKGDKVGICQSV